MKKIILYSLSIFASIALYGQTDVVLKLNHKLGTEDFMLDQVAKNNLGHEYKTTRLEYYVSKITIVHDGGMETDVPLEVIELVRPEDEISTSIPLGSYDVTDIEGVKFYTGVYEPVNHGDPSLFPEDHPLAPKSPSMHWGWAAGYRFVAYEGSGGVDFSQGFQMHSLGEMNYFQVEADVDVVVEGGALIMNLIGNYERGLDDIDLTSGIISHGDVGYALQVLENWRDLVFGNYYLSLAENPSIEWSVYPNPTIGQFTVNLSATNQVSRIAVTNMLGEELINQQIGNETIYTYELSVAGMYMVMLYNSNGETIAAERLVID
ncbi:T9SS type A sorting domain-containing protein [Crocinitomix sp.]|nr:T9SS type A sorting domain-containing protein [Crocinitomix sp.]